MGTRGREIQDTGKQSLTLPPPSEQARPAPYNIQWRGGGGGRSGGLKGLGDLQVASRAVPFPGPMAEQGVRAAMADLGTRAAMADQVTRAVMADLGTRAAMADQVVRATMVWF